MKFKPLYLALFVLCSITLASLQSRASHMIGNQFYYQLVDSSSGSYTYQFTLKIYSDALNGTPLAIDEDTPAFFGVYNGSGFYRLVLLDTAVRCVSQDILPATDSSGCGMLVLTPYLTLRRTFTATYTLPASTSGYLVSYQRCCLNAAVSDVSDPANAGQTYLCVIPPTATATYNNCAVFRQEAPQFAALGNPFFFNCSATDADGDSLSYGFAAPLSCCGGTSSNVKPFPQNPPYDSISYNYPYTARSPMLCSSPLAIDPVTGIITGTPNAVGRYLIGVCCNEWRSGVLINTSFRTFEVTVVSGISYFFKPVAGPDTAVYTGDTVQFYSSGAIAYSWSPAGNLSDSVISNPIAWFPTSGTYHYVLTATADSGCSGSDTITIAVLNHSGIVIPNAFSPNGDSRNQLLKPIPQLNSTLLSFSVYNRNGIRMFTTANIDDGWDGRYHGVVQDLGVYVWQIEYVDNTGVSRKETGNVLLLK